MKVALCPSAFFPSLGGVEELSSRLAQTLVSRGHEVRIYTERWPRSLAAVDVIKGLEVRRLAFRVPEARGLKPKLTWAAGYIPTQRALRADLVGFKPDVMHVQCVSSAVDYVIPAARNLRIPVVVSLQGELSMDASGIYLQPGPGQRRMERALAAADAITGCSQQTLHEADEFYQKMGGSSFGQRGQVIYNGIDQSEFDGLVPPIRDRPYVFAVGRHVYQKGFDVLLRAFVAGQFAKTHDLVLAGDGAEHESLRSLAVELGLGDSAVLTGRMTHDHVRRHLAGAVAFVLSSRHEPFGIVNLEAMAAGCPVVATRVGGVPEFVEDGVTGLLVEAGSVQALTAGIKDVLADPASALKRARGRALCRL